MFYSSLILADLVKIKDSVYPRSFVNASSAGRLGRYTSVDGEMSSHEDSSIGSDSEDDPIERHAATCTRIERSRSKNDSPLSRPSSFSMDEPSRKPDSREIHDRDVTEEFCSEGAERQVGNPFKMSLFFFAIITYARCISYTSYSKYIHNFFYLFRLFYFVYNFICFGYYKYIIL